MLVGRVSAEGSLSEVSPRPCLSASSGGSSLPCARSRVLKLFRGVSENAPAEGCSAYRGPPCPLRYAGIGATSGRRILHRGRVGSARILRRTTLRNRLTKCTKEVIPGR